MSEEVRQPEEAEVEAAPAAPQVDEPAVEDEAVRSETAEATAEDNAADEVESEESDSDETDSGETTDAASSEAAEPVYDADLEAAEAAMDDEPEVVVAPGGPIEVLDEEDEDIQLNWYILKVQSNRERSSSNALKRKVAIEGIEHLFGEIIVPTEKVTEFKNGKKKVVERKIWPGYIAVQMHVCDETWFAIRETAGIGDFTGASGKPVPMQPNEIAMILPQEEEEGTDDVPKLNIKFTEGDKVKVKDGNFENFEGEVHAIDQQNGKVTIMISIFGRSTPVELEYWQVETL